MNAIASTPSRAPAGFSAYMALGGSGYADSEDESVEDAARRQGIKPGQAFRAMRWMTEAEWAAKEAEQDILIRDEK
jgi:hypothetical protein